jgi:hypothetical protein
MSSEGQNDLRETGPEKQHPKKKHAVSVSPWMKKNVLPLRTGFESDFKALAEDEEKIEKLHDEIEKYVTEWRVAAEKLPATSRRSRDNPISEAWIAAARKEFEPVDNSWVLLCHILKVLVRLLRYFDEGDTLKTTRAVLKERGFFHEEAVLESKGLQALHLAPLVALPPIGSREEGSERVRDRAQESMESQEEGQGEPWPWPHGRRVGASPQDMRASPVPPEGRLLILE